MKRKAGSKGWSKKSSDTRAATAGLSDVPRPRSTPTNQGSTTSKALTLRFLAFCYTLYSEVYVVLEREGAFKKVTIQSKYSPTQSPK